MKLNLSLLHGDSSFSSRDNRDSRDASNHAALSVPAVAGISRDEPGQDHLKPVPTPADMASVPAVPAASRLSRDSETQQRRGLPVVPAVPARKSNVGAISVPVGIAGVLAANDDPKVAARVEHPGPLVLTFELDAGRATCIDPVSTSLADAVADIRRQFPGRVGRFWRGGCELVLADTDV